MSYTHQVILLFPGATTPPTQWAIVNLPDEPSTDSAQVRLLHRDVVEISDKDLLPQIVGKEITIQLHKDEYRLDNRFCLPAYLIKTDAD